MYLISFGIIRLIYSMIKLETDCKKFVAHISNALMIKLFNYKMADIIVDISTSLFI